MVRFQNGDVYRNIDGVLDTILAALVRRQTLQALLWPIAHPLTPALSPLEAGRGKSRKEVQLLSSCTRASGHTFLAISARCRWWVR